MTERELAKRIYLRLRELPISQVGIGGPITRARDILADAVLAAMAETAAHEAAAQFKATTQ